VNRPVHSHTPRAYSETMSLSVEDSPRRHRLTVEDYYRMAEVGILAPDARVELIDGDIIDIPPPGTLHAATVDQLVEIFNGVLDARFSVRGQNPVRLDDLSELQPDVALLRRQNHRYREHPPRPQDTLLIVEVADSSLRFDRDKKMRLYARHEIPEAWLVDLRGRRLVRYQAPLKGEYTRVDEPDLGAALDVAALPGIAVALHDLFG
jgi:Uma2 family endonuclease